MPAAILQLTPHLDACDPGRDALDLARHLRSRGGRPVVASSGGTLLRELAASGVTHLQAPLARAGLFARWHSSAKIARAIREHRLDAVHAHTAALAPIAAAAARSAGVPCVVTLREGAAPDAARDALRRADRLIAVSEFVAGRIAATLSLPSGRLRVVRRWIDLAEFDPERVRGHRVSALAERCGIAPGSRVLLVPTLPAGDRGHLVLLQAMARLPRTDFVALFGGGLEPDSRYGTEVLAAVRRAGLAERVRFAVGSDDLAAIIALADLVALPATHPDPTGFLAVAAQAMGRPVIVSNRGALPEAVMPAATGWMVEAGDADELATALGLALDMTEEPRRRLAARARAFVTDEFGLTANADRILAIYRGLGDTPLARAG
jgi:glycosyltransferase involved in cell wall biosynthesis